MVAKQEEDDNDFGFSFVEPTDTSHLEQELLKGDQKFDDLYALIMPLLKNLKKNPEKPQIVWPDRVKKIDAFIAKMDALKNS
jgi:hypothetical protein